MSQQGSRSSSSACGSADVLEELGVNIQLGPEVVRPYEFNTNFLSLELIILLF